MKSEEEIYESVTYHPMAQTTSEAHSPLSPPKHPTLNQLILHKKIAYQIAPLKNEIF